MSIISKFTDYVKKTYDEDIDLSSYEAGRRNVLEKLSEYMDENEIKIDNKAGSKIVHEYKEINDKKKEEKAKKTLVLKPIKTPLEWYQNLDCTIQQMTELYGEPHQSEDTNIQNEWFFKYGDNDIVVHDLKNARGLHIEILPKDIKKSLNKIFQKRLNCTLVKDEEVPMDVQSVEPDKVRKNKVVKEKVVKEKVVKEKVVKEKKSREPKKIETDEETFEFEKKLTLFNQSD